MMLETSFVLPRGNLPGKAEPAGDLIELAQHQIEMIAELLGISDTEVAASIANGRAAFLVVVDDVRKPEAAAILFFNPNDRSDFRTLYAAMVADEPDYCFGELAGRAEMAAERNGYRYLDLSATGAVGLEGYSIQEAEPRRVIVGKLILAN